ncbi:MAG: hypothetical protein E6R07_01435 [Nevskiaceae bacterium]|nr:MAG: hypothetical protein E6R07_01435 [Nevskiaceae bacterium]
MSNERTTVVDFVAKGETPEEWKMVLVEEGPWKGAIQTQLRRVQERLYGCLDAALDGQLAEKFPESNGKRVVIQLDCYNLPRDKVAEFFNNFSSGVLEMPDYQQALKESSFVKGISFELNFEAVH